MPPMWCHQGYLGSGLASYQKQYACFTNWDLERHDVLLILCSCLHLCSCTAYLRDHRSQLRYCSISKPASNRGQFQRPDLLLRPCYRGHTGSCPVRTFSVLSLFQTFSKTWGSIISTAGQPGGTGEAEGVGLPTSELHCGNCTIQCFWTLTYVGDIFSPLYGSGIWRCLGHCCINVDRSNLMYTNLRFSMFISETKTIAHYSVHQQEARINLFTVVGPLTGH